MSSIWASGYENPKVNKNIIDQLKSLDAAFAAPSNDNNPVESMMTKDTRLARELCEVDHGLSDWEVNFVESVARRVLDKKIPFTTQQRAKATQIMEKIDRLATE